MANALGFVTLPPLYWLCLAVMLLGYAILTQVVKIGLFAGLLSITLGEPENSRGWLIAVKPITAKPLCRGNHIQGINPKIVAWSFPPVVLAVLASWRFLDARVALGVMELLKSSDLLRAGISNIPDVLFLLVCFSSALLWCNYLILRHQGINNDQSRFSQITGVAIPLSYFLKWFSKYVFGRINTRIWLANQVSGDFHWFQGGGDYSSFPSGHMTVFAAFFAAVWLYYPRYRFISIGLMLVLALALVATDYHFLSDVIAGAYLGLFSTFLTRIFFEKIWR